MLEPQVPPSGQQGAGTQQGYQYKEADEMDQKIAVGLATTQVLSPEGSQVVAKALSSQNPPKMLAGFLARLIEMIMTHSASTEIPISPVVWLSEGGAVDELGEIIQVVAEKNGIQIDVQGMMPQVKQELLTMSQAASSKMQEQEAAQGQQQPQQVPPSGPQIGAPMQ